MSDTTYFGLKEIEQASTALAPFLSRTPTVAWPLKSELYSQLGKGHEATRVAAKLELLQVTGTFKPRGALTVMSQLSPAQRARGVVAVSGGNHAIAVAYASSILEISARVVVPRSMNPARFHACQRYGVTPEYANDIKAAFEECARIADTEGRFMVHPFEGPLTALGNATLGLEFLNQTPDLEVMLISAGGGGLVAGVARATSLIKPSLRVIAVEPFGADSLWRSFQQGSPVQLEKVDSIADSLGSPRALPYSFELCRTHVEKVVRVSDSEIRNGMRLCFHDLKLATEPAGAAAVAALAGPLKDELKGKKIGVLICGSNIDPDTFCRHLSDCT